jgi:glutamyl-tRNA synthetase
MHIGSLRTALYSYLFAKKHKGDFILRIEDTDQSRKVEGADEQLDAALKIFGLQYDEGPFFQSQRLEMYKNYVDQLIASDKAYYSFRSPGELEGIRKELDMQHRPLKRADLNENYSAEEINEKIASGEKFVVRIEMPQSGSISFTDLVRGDITFDYAQVDDQVIMKSDGFPTYHLAVVVDDHEMNISHVIRGEEWISSTPKHLYLYEAFGWEAPQFAHIPLILNPDKSKLSKRQGDVAAEDYLAKGYLPETLINFVALLGWNPGEGSTEEFFSLDELISAFSLEKVNKAGAVFDTTKLDWMNAKYLREKISLEEFLRLIENDLREFLGKHRCAGSILEDEKKLHLFTQLIRERVERLTQVSEWFDENQWLDEPAPHAAELITWKKSTLKDAQEKLGLLHAYFSDCEDSLFDSVESLEAAVKEWIQSNEFGMGDVLWPLRVTLTGQERSPNPFEIAYLVGKEEVIRRLRNEIDR